MKRIAIITLFWIGTVCALCGGFLNLGAEGFGDKPPDLTADERRRIKFVSLVVPACGIILLVASGIVLVVIDKKPISPPASKRGAPPDSI